MAVGEDGLVVVQQGSGHADGGVRRDDPLLVLERLRGEASVAAADAVGEAEALEDDGGEVGEFLEGQQRRLRGVVWDGGGQLCGKLGQLVWVVE